jgi:YD repeat-containing protein
MSQLKNIIRESSGRARLVVVGVALLLVLSLLGSYYFFHPKENLIEPVHANEGPIMYTLSISTVDLYGPDVANTVTLSPSGGVYEDGTVVTLTPVSANWTWPFLNWSGDLSGSANPTTITMDEDKSVTATFGAVYGLTTAASGSGTVTPATGLYFGNATVNVTATANTGWSFSHWTGDLSGSDPTQSIAMNNANKTVTGVFTASQHTFTPGSASNGSFTWSPTGTTFDYGTVLTLTATPNANYDFSHWTGNASGTNPVTTVTMTANRTATPVFQLVDRTLIPETPAGGTISWTPTGTTHPHGTVLTFTATANPGKYFNNWTGSGPWTIIDDDEATLIMDADKIAAAIFKADVTPPVLTLIGVTPIGIDPGDPYTDAGATATDELQGDITGDIVVTGYPFDTNVIGTHVITYTVTDAGNNTTQLTRTVIVNDNVPPVLTLVGSSPETIPHGGTYVEPGATATDNLDGDITNNIVIGGPTVNPNVIGTYVITYNVTDAALNAAAQVTRTVNVTDQTPPVITLTGDSPLTIEQGAPFTDPEATASDIVDGDVTANIVTAGDVVDTTVIGTYLITYDVSDAALNAAAQVTRSVDVVAQTPLGLMGDLSNPDNFAPVNHIQHMVAGFHGGLGPFTGFPDPTGTGSFQAVQFPKTTIPGLREHHQGLAPAAADLAITAEGVTAQINPVQNSISLHEKDFHVKTAGNLELVFHRTYVNPYGFHNDYYVNKGDGFRRNNTIGEGWTHSFNMHLRPSFDGGWLFFVDEHGNATEYVLYDTVTQGLNWFEPADTNVTTASLGTYITHDSTTSLYTLYMPGGFKYVFYGNATDQTYLDTIQDAAGNTIQFNYHPGVPHSADLDTVDLPATDGRFLKFVYTNDLISQVTLENGTGVLQTVDYTHTGNYLTNVTVNGVTDDKVVYAYDSPVTPADGVYMSKITDRDENDYTFDFVYGTFGVDEGDHITVTYPNGLLLKLTRQVNNQFATIQRDRGPEIFGGIRYEETDQERHLHEFKVNTEGEPVTGIWDNRTYTYTDNRDLVGITPSGFATPQITMAYNNAGRLTSVQHLDGVTDPQWTWTYPTVNDLYPTGYTDPEFGTTNFYYVAGTDKLDYIEAPFYDDFEDGDLNGWTTGGGTWNIVNGMAKNDASVNWPYIRVANTSADNEVRFDYINHSASATLSDNYMFAEVRRTDGSNQLRVKFAEDSARIENLSDATGSVVMTILAEDLALASAPETLYHVRVVSAGNSIAVYRAEEGQPEAEVLSYTGANLTTLTTEKFFLFAAPNAQFSFDNVFVDGDGAHFTESYQYDPAGQMTTVTTRGTDTHYGYDARGNITSVTEPGVGITSRTYDDLGNITSVTEPNLDTTTYLYDDLLFPNKITTITRPGGTPVETYSYNANGGLEKKIGHDGFEAYAMYYIYDEFNRLTEVYKTNVIPAAPHSTSVETLVAGLSPVVELTYDALGQLTQVVNIGFAVTDFVYNHMGWVIQRNRNYTDSHIFTYDYLGNITSVQIVGGAIIPYSEADDPNGEVNMWTHMGIGPNVKDPKVTLSLPYSDERIESGMESRTESTDPAEEEKEPRAIPSISWTTESVTVSEGASQINLTAVLSESSDETITVDYGPYNEQGAVAGQDYDIPAGVFTFGPGETFKQITVSILDDGVAEAAESFSMFLAPFLSAPTNVISGNIQTVTVAIIDDDVFPSFDVSIPTGPLPKMVTFTDTTVAGPGVVTGWSWDFDGNGTEDSTLQNPTHSYTAEGQYDVTLTVSTAVEGFSDSALIDIVSGYLLTINVQGPGSVATTSGIYPVGQTVQLVPIADPGYAYHHWDGDTVYPDMENEAFKALMDQDVDITAVFYPSISVDTVGVGTIHFDPPGPVHPTGTQITAHLMPASGYTFNQLTNDFSGMTVGGDNTFTFTLNGPMGGGVIFDETRHVITNSITGQGTVTTIPVQPDYAASERVKLKAAPTAGWRFVRWEGDFAPDNLPPTFETELKSSIEVDATIDFRIHSNRNVTAVFEEIPQLTTTTSGTGSGQVITENAGPVQNPEGVVKLLAVTDEAVPAQFSHWEGDVEGIDVNSPGIEVSLETSKTINAVFGNEFGIIGLEDDALSNGFPGSASLEVLSMHSGSKYVGFKFDGASQYYGKGISISPEPTEIYPTLTRGADPDINKLTYPLGETVTFAVPDTFTWTPFIGSPETFDFQFWEMTASYTDGSGDPVVEKTYRSSNTFTWESLDDKTYNLQPNYAPQDWERLTIDISPGGGVTVNDDDIQIGGNEPHGSIPDDLEIQTMRDKIEWSYPAGSVVTITAIPDPGSFFHHWILDDGVTTDSNATVVTTMDAAKTYTAVFAPGYIIDVEFEGRGSVTHSLSAATFSDNFSFAVTANGAVTLEAIPVSTPGLESEMGIWVIDHYVSVRQSEFTFRPIGNTKIVVYFIDKGIMADLDGDEIWDEWEGELGIDINPTLDPDLDQLTNLEEFWAGTDINDSDTDGDGLPDKWEIDNALNATMATNSAGADGDPDNDGATNLEEYQALTNPTDFSQGTAQFAQYVQSNVENSVTGYTESGWIRETEPVSVAANDNSGDWEFSHWEGSIQSTGSNIAYQASDHMFHRAIFTPMYEFTLAAPFGEDFHIANGSLTTSHADGVYPAGTLITLTVDPTLESDFYFNGWYGVNGWYAGNGPLQGIKRNGVTELTFELQEDSSVIVMYIPNSSPFNIEIEGDAEGVQVAGGPLMQTGETYDAPVDTMVTLKAMPAEGTYFSHWEGDIYSTEEEIEISASSEKNVNAVFRNLHELHILIGIPNPGSAMFGSPYLYPAPVSRTTDVSSNGSLINLRAYYTEPTFVQVRMPNAIGGTLGPLDFQRWVDPDPIAGYHGKPWVLDNPIKVRVNGFEYVEFHYSAINWTNTFMNYDIVGSGNVGFSNWDVQCTVDDAYHFATSPFYIHDDFYDLGQVAVGPFDSLFQGFEPAVNIEEWYVADPDASLNDVSRIWGDNAHRDSVHVPGIAPGFYIMFEETPNDGIAVGGAIHESDFPMSTSITFTTTEKALFATWEGAGTVWIDPVNTLDGVTTTNDGRSAEYKQGGEAEIRAIPLNGWTFTHWNLEWDDDSIGGAPIGNGSDDREITIAMVEDIKATAVFVETNPVIVKFLNSVNPTYGDANDSDDIMLHAYSDTPNLLYTVERLDGTSISASRVSKIELTVLDPPSTVIRGPITLVNNPNDVTNVPVGLDWFTLLGGAGFANSDKYEFILTVTYDEAGVERSISTFEYGGNHTIVDLVYRHRPVFRLAKSGDIATSDVSPPTTYRYAMANSELIFTDGDGEDAGQFNGAPTEFHHINSAVANLQDSPDHDLWLAYGGTPEGEAARKGRPHLVEPVGSNLPNYDTIPFELYAYPIVDEERGFVFLQYWVYCAVSYTPENYMLGIRPEADIPQTHQDFVHEGDWEMVQVAVKLNPENSGTNPGVDPLSAKLQPFSMTASQHFYGQTLRWNSHVTTGHDNVVGFHYPEKVAGGLRPIVYVARNAHAMYFREGLFNTSFNPTGDRNIQNDVTIGLSWLFRDRTGRGKDYNASSAQILSMWEGEAKTVNDTKRLGWGTYGGRTAGDKYAHTDANGPPSTRGPGEDANTRGDFGFSFFYGGQFHTVNLSPIPHGLLIQSSPVEFNNRYVIPGQGEEELAQNIAHID